MSDKEVVYYEPSQKKSIDAAIKNNIPVMLVGETGVGKTVLVADMARRKKKKLLRLSINEQVGREDIIGKFGLNDGNTQWVDGPVLQAVKEGQWVVLDELNSARPEVLFALHSLLDTDRGILLNEKDNEWVKAHKNFRFFATMNPISYHGTKDLNQAFLSRFVVVNIDCLDAEKEFDLVKSKVEITDEDLNYLIEISQFLRRVRKDGGIEYFCSTRDVIMAASMVSIGLSCDSAVISSIVNKMSHEDVEYLSNGYHSESSGSVGIIKIINESLKSEQPIIDRIRELKEERQSKEEVIRKYNEIESLIELKSKELEDLKRDIANKNIEFSNAENELKELKEKTEKEVDEMVKEYIKKKFI